MILEKKEFEKNCQLKRNYGLYYFHRELFSIKNRKIWNSFLKLDIFKSLKNELFSSLKKKAIYLFLRTNKTFILKKECLK